MHTNAHIVSQTLRCFHSRQKRFQAQFSHVMPAHSDLYSQDCIGISFLERPQPFKIYARLFIALVVLWVTQSRCPQADKRLDRQNTVLYNGAIKRLKTCGTTSSRIYCCCNPLRKQAIGVNTIQASSFKKMRMEVNQPRRHNVAICVDCILSIQMSCGNINDLSSLNPYGTDFINSSRRINDPAILDDNIQTSRHISRPTYRR